MCRKRGRRVGCGLWLWINSVGRKGEVKKLPIEMSVRCQAGAVGEGVDSHARMNCAVNNNHCARMKVDAGENGCPDAAHVASASRIAVGIKHQGYVEVESAGVFRGACRGGDGLPTPLRKRLNGFARKECVDLLARYTYDAEL